MKIKKNIPLIDQHNKFGMWGNKFGGNFVPETLKKTHKRFRITICQTKKKIEIYSRKILF